MKNNHENKPNLEQALLPFAPPQCLEERTEGISTYSKRAIGGGIIGLVYGIAGVSFVHYFDGNTISLDLYLSHPSYITGTTLLGVLVEIAEKFYSGEQ